MHRVIVIQFTTLDGFTQDPDGAEGTRNGGWAFRLGPQAVAGDKFKMGELLDTSALLLGRRTWERFHGDLAEPQRRFLDQAEPDASVTGKGRNPYN